MYDIPVLFLIFNRPELTKATFNRIRAIRPKYLYIAADGPRKKIKGEEDLCQQTREVVLDSVDWSCDVKCFFNDHNLGCGTAVSLALDWFFSHVEMGIIIEDDILTTNKFFEYMHYCLKKFEHDLSIYSISGNSLGLDTGLGLNYFRSNYFNMWGWATWKRSWSLMNQTWKALNENSGVLTDNMKTSLRLFKYCDNSPWWEHWQKILADTVNGRVDTWDYQWVFAALENKKTCIFPTRIIVQNIGFGSDATHTKNHALTHKLGRGITQENTFNIENPKEVIIADYELKYIMDAWNNFSIDSFAHSSKSILKYLLSYFELMRARNLLKDYHTKLF